jgi:hypothetical protein
MTNPADTLTVSLSGPIAIGIPSGDFVDAEFCMSLTTMMAEHRIPHVLINARGCYVYKGRNFCVKTAQAKKCSKLLFLDSDMTFPPLTLIRLLSHQKDIVGAMYSRRVAPFTNLGTPTDKTMTKVNTQTPLVEMDMLPTGVLLIDMKVFDKLERPYFYHRLIDGRDPDDDMGEDVYFCEKAKQAGFQLWADVPLSMQIGHIGQATYRVADDTKQAAALIGEAQQKINGVAEPIAQAAAE